VVVCSAFSSVEFNSCLVGILVQRWHSVASRVAFFSTVFLLSTFLGIKLWSTSPSIDCNGDTSDLTCTPGWFRLFGSHHKEATRLTVLLLISYKLCSNCIFNPLHAYGCWFFLFGCYKLCGYKLICRSKFYGCLSDKWTELKGEL